MLDDFELPGLERIGAVERRRLVEVPVPGLEGSFHQDLGSGPIAIVIEGNLAGDDGRDAFLGEIQSRFDSGRPVDFVADIISATRLEQVHLADVWTKEVAGSPDTFRYVIVLTQYTEPPPPAGDLGFDDLGDLEAALDLEAGDLFDVLQIPDLLSSVPELSDPTPPLRGVLGGVADALAPLQDVSGAIGELFGP